MTHILNGPAVPLAQSNLLSWKRKYPRHYWCLDRLVISDHEGYRAIGVQLTQSIRESGQLGEQSMLFLWEKAGEFERLARESLGRSSSGNLL